MARKSINPASKEADATFYAGIESIESSNNEFGTISEDDKKGGKLFSTIEPLLDIAMQSVPRVEKELPRRFDVQEMIADKATRESNKLKVAALRTAIKKVQDADAVASVRLSKNFRTIYDAAQKLRNDDASLTVLCEILGAPFQRTVSAERKAAIAERKVQIAAEKSRKAEERVARKTAKAAAKAAKN
jgi:hypothetical protein